MPSAKRTITVRAPNRHFSGERAGVAFEAGEGEATLPQARELRGRGYDVPGLDEAEQEERRAPSEKLLQAPLPVLGTATPIADLEGEASEKEPHEEPGGVADAEAAREALMAVDGIGDGYARRLVRAGIETRGALRAAVAGDLSRRTGITEERIQAFQEDA